jgi:hypothetical protein
MLFGPRSCICPLGKQQGFMEGLPHRLVTFLADWAFRGAALAQDLALPAAPSERRAWLTRALDRATARLQQESLQPAIVDKILKVMATMERGREKEHFCSMLRETDYRGSDVRLATGTLLDGCRQDAPYPAFCWDWATVQSYSWKHHQHINALEFSAFLNYVRSQVGSKDFHQKRFFHVFDSRVVSCVVAKGRSSSRILNRLCRRLAAFVLAANCYALCFWTISKWNHSDAASRRLQGEDG